MKFCDKIAESGTSGHSTGPHLHFQVIINGKPVDPEPTIMEAIKRMAGVTKEVISQPKYLYNLETVHGVVFIRFSTPFSVLCKVVYEVTESTKYIATMEFLADYFVKNKKTVATALTTKYCEDLWDKLVYCPYEISLTN